MANQNSGRHSAHQKIIFGRYWWLAIFTLLAVAAQCGAPMPPLPEKSQESITTIAILSPTEGELASFGQMFRNGISMAFDAHNQRRSADDQRFDWRTYNTDCTFQSGKQTTQQAIDDGAKFIIGPICSEAAIAAATIAEANDVLLIAPAATNPLVTVNSRGDARPTVFRTAYIADLQGQAAAQFATGTLGADTAAIIIKGGDSYSAELTDAFIPQFTTAGGQVVYQNTFIPGVTDSANLLIEMVDSGAELIYLPVDTSIANQIGSQFSKLNDSSKRPVIIGSDTWALGELDATALTGSYYPVHFTWLNEEPAVQEWATAYKSRFAVEPNSLAALGFDAANILADAITQSDELEPTSVSKIIANGAFNGVTGPITFDARNNPVKPVPFLSVGQERTVEYVVPVP